MRVVQQLAGGRAQTRALIPPSPREPTTIARASRSSAIAMSVSATLAESGMESASAVAPSSRASRAPASATSPAWPDGRGRWRPPRPGRAGSPWSARRPGASSSPSPARAPTRWRRSTGDDRTAPRPRAAPPAPPRSRRRRARPGGRRGGHARQRYAAPRAAGNHPDRVRCAAGPLASVARRCCICACSVPRRSWSAWPRASPRCRAPRTSCARTRATVTDRRS